MQTHVHRWLRSFGLQEKSICAPSQSNATDGPMNCSKGIRVSVELASLATVYQVLYPNVAFEHAPMAHENFSCT